MDEEQITDREVLKALGLDEMPTPVSEDKQGMFSFFKRIISNTFNIKTGNLNEIELGMVKIPVRTNLELAGYCEAMGMLPFAKAFKNDAQVVLGTSLSRDGFLIREAVTTRREGKTEVKSQKPQVKRGWFDPTVPSGGV